MSSKKTVVRTAQATRNRTALVSAVTSAASAIDHRFCHSGRVLSQLVDLGQVVNPGTQLAEVYATDYVEIRLPIPGTTFSRF